jgi:hypothetical protein
MGPALLIALSGAAEPALFGKINMGLNMLQSLLLPFAMLPMLHFTGSVAVMGRFAGSRPMRAATALCAVLVCAINLLVLVPYLSTDDGYRHCWRAGAALYAAVLVRLVGSEAAQLGRWLGARAAHVHMHALALLRDALDAVGLDQMRWPPRELRARLLPEPGSPFGMQPAGVQRAFTSESFDGEVNFPKM